MPNDAFRLTPNGIRLIKAAVFVLSLFPAGRLIYAVLVDPGSLGANPAEAIQHTTGDWCLNFLLLTLAVTPVRRLSGWAWPIKLRRMLGLFAFFYCVAHFASYLAFDKLFDMAAVMRDVVKRPFILVGFVGLLLMTPLAITSTNGWVKRLGGQNWSRLHKAVYAIAILGVVHYWWLVKRDIMWPVYYAIAFACLFGFRLAKNGLKNRNRSSVVKR